MKSSSPVIDAVLGLGECGDVVEVDGTRACALHVDQVVASGDGYVHVSESDLERATAKLLIGGGARRGG